MRLGLSALPGSGIASSENNRSRERVMKSSMIIALLGLCCSACAVESPLVVGPSSYEVIPAEQPSVATEAYVVGPLDTVDITVFQEPQLSATELTVDPSGRLPMPLIG